MAGVRLRIHLSREAYGSGDSVEGCVSLELQESLDILGLELLIYGGARVLLEGEKTRGQAEPLTEEELYLCDTLLLWGDALSPRPELLEDGKHSFPFFFVLPTDVPCSFESEEGWVRYYTQATVVLASPEPDIVFRQHLNVVRDLDLSNQPTLDVSAEEKSMPLAMCCHPGRISCNLNVPNSAVVPGEYITAEIRVANTTMMRLKGVCLLLKQEVQSRPSESKGQVSSCVLAQSACPSIPPGSRGTPRCLRLRVPPAPPSGLHGCSLIDVKYTLILHIPLSPSPIDTGVPIIIGTIPVKANPGAIITFSYEEEDKKAFPRSQQWTLSPSSHEMARLCNSSAICRPMYKTYNLAEREPLTLQKFLSSPKVLKKCGDDSMQKQVRFKDTFSRATESVV